MTKPQVLGLKKSQVLGLKLNYSSLINTIYVLSAILLSCVLSRVVYANNVPPHVPLINYHLFTETEGNSVFCGPETVDVSRGEAEGNIDGRGFTKHTAFPRSQQISVLLYINSQRNNKLKNK